VLVIASGNWYGTTASNGACRIDHSGAAGQSVNLGQTTGAHTSSTNAAGWSLTQLYVNVPSGAQSFGVLCSENAADIKMTNIKVVAVRLAASALLP
jgi:hypothetical protein